MLLIHAMQGVRDSFTGQERQGHPLVVLLPLFPPLPLHHHLLYPRIAAFADDISESVADGICGK